MGTKTSEVGQDLRRREDFFSPGCGNGARTGTKQLGMGGKGN
jgi:hypothetical protein